MHRIVVLLLLPAVAMADSTLPIRPEAGRPSAKPCNSDDGPFFKDGLRLSRKHFPLVSRTAHFGLYSKQVGDLETFLVFALDDQTKAAELVVDHRALGIVEGEEGTLLGVLGREGNSSISLIGPRGLVWTSPPLADSFDTVTAQVSGDLLIVAGFRRYLSGSSLQAFDRTTGKIKWQAKVLQLGIDHSAYTNDVALRTFQVPKTQRPESFVFPTEVEMNGYEAGGCYTQVFNFVTGERLRATMR